MKVLIISNNPLSKSGSNGRTMLNMLECFNKEEILNVFLSGADFSAESALYYQVKDINVLKNKIPYGGFIDNKIVFVSKNNKKAKNGPLKYLIRSIIWSKKSIKKEFLGVARAFGPDRIIIQCGDSDFLINISCWLSEQLSVPLISFNTEAYIFKKWNYMSRKSYRTLIFRFFFRRLVKSYNSLYNACDRFIYLTEDLKKLYTQAYGHHYSYVIYNSSSIKSIDSYNRNGDIVYCGNLGLGRDKTIIELSAILFTVYKKSITVYSNCTDENIVNRMKKCSHIIYKGCVSYDEIVSIISNASLLLYCESFNNYYLKDSEYAFSTKIADMICSGVPGVYVCPENSSVFRYLKKYNSGILITDIDDKKHAISQLSRESSRFSDITRNQLDLGLKNHNAQRNSKYFYDILKSGHKYTFQVLVTTIDKDFEQMIELAKQMNIKSDAIIRSQCNYNKRKTILFNGYNLELVCSSDKGCSKNRNELFKLSSSDYILFSDDDQVFYDDYLEKILTSVKFSKADYTDFSFDYDNGLSESFGNSITSSKSINTNLGVWNIVLRRDKIKNLRFNEKIGPGCDIDNGEDNLFRYNLIHSDLIHATTDKKIFVIRDSSANSTCSQGEDFKKIRSRCFVYGYIHPVLYKIYLIRLYIQLKNKNKYNFKILTKFAKEGKIERHAHFH